MRIATILMLLLALLGSVTLTSAQTTEPVIAGGEIIASGFNYPQGVLVDADGGVWVIEAGLGDGDLTPMAYGMTARLVKITPAGEQIEIARLPSLAVTADDILGGARLAFLDGILYATVGGWRDDLGGERPPLMGALVKIADGAVTEVADLWAYEAAHNPDGLALNARPYGLAARPDGELWIADSGGNDILRVNPQTGDIQTVTAFTGGRFSTTPTGIAFTSDGQAYVVQHYHSSQPGFNAFALAATGDKSDYRMTQLNLTDVSTGPDGDLYAVAFNAAQGHNAGMILRLSGPFPEILVNTLPAVNALAFDSAGNAYVTLNSAGDPGTGAVARFRELTAMDGTYWMPPAPTSSDCGCG